VTERTSKPAPPYRSTTAPSNVLSQDGAISGVVDWDHLGVGSSALDLTSVLFDWQRLRLPHESSVTADGGERLRGRIIEIAGEHALHCTICYSAIARLALSRQRGEPEQVETWRRVTESILDSFG
jgi:aminoglycoside phosphotransferase (APT) family kinase protein